MLDMKRIAPIFFLGMGILVSGCGNDLDCASGPAKGTVAQLVQKQLQQEIIEFPFTLLPGAPQRYATEIDKCEKSGIMAGKIGRMTPGGTRTPPCEDEALREAKKAWAAASYTLNAIRMTARDTATGAVACAAELRIDVSDWGSIKEPITYKVEKTSDGNIYVTVLQ